MSDEEQGWLDELLQLDSGLSPRECDFIDDLDQGWRNRDLTDRQADWLESLYNRAIR